MHTNTRKSVRIDNDGIVCILSAGQHRAVAFRDPATGSTTGVIFHADRGCQGGFNRLSQHRLVGARVAGR